MPNDPSQDQEFLNAEPHEQHAYLMATDPDYAKAAPHEQVAYLSHVSPKLSQTQFEKDRTPQGSAISRGAKAFGTGLLKTASGVVDAFGEGLSGPNPKSIAESAANMSLADQQRKEEGRSGAYRGLALGASMVGVDPTGMEEASRHGDTAGVWGSGLGQAAVASAPLAGEAIGKGIGAGAKAVGRRVVDATGRPKPIARLILGSDRATALGELANPEFAAARVGRQAKNEALAAGRTAPGPWTPTKAIKAANAPPSKTSMASEAASAEESVGTKIYPEPRDPLPGDKPGAMWTIPRKELPSAAEGGVPGAGDVMRNLNKPIVYVPREGVGYAPRGDFEAAQGRMQQADSVGTQIPQSKATPALDLGASDFSDIPQEAINPRELEDASRQAGRPISAEEFPEWRRQREAERNVSEGLKGNRKDTAGEIREQHRAKLEKKGSR